jgi:hypothetical protein
MKYDHLGNDIVLIFNALHSFPYCLREGDGERVKKNQINILSYLPPGWTIFTYLV